MYVIILHISHVWNYSHEQITIKIVSNLFAGYQLIDNMICVQKTV